MLDQLTLAYGPGIIQWFFAVVGIATFILLVGLAVFIWWLKKQLSRPDMLGMSREEVKKRWHEIRETGESNGQMGKKLALMEADKLLDSSLKSMMIPGETLGERLKVACYKYPKLKDVWWAHKLRNQLVHQHDFRLSDREARRALDEFEKAFKTLNVI